MSLISSRVPLNYTALTPAADNWFVQGRQDTNSHLSEDFMTNSQSSSGGSGPLIIVGLVVLLLILHQDNWFWTDGTLVFGFMPIGLFWHACISIAATLTWWLATKIAWPHVDGDTAAGNGQSESTEGQQ